MAIWDTLLWLYLIDAVLLIVHEIDSAYWREWELFRLPGGVAGFLLLHVPLMFAGLYGLLLVSWQSRGGLIVSAVLSLAGIFAFAIHTYFIRKGRHEFRAPISQLILWATLLVSLAQGAITAALLVA